MVMRVYTCKLLKLLSLLDGGIDKVCFYNFNAVSFRVIVKAFAIVASGKILFIMLVNNDFIYFPPIFPQFKFKTLISFIHMHFSTKKM